MRCKKGDMTRDEKETEEFIDEETVLLAPFPVDAGLLYPRVG